MWNTSAANPFHINLREEGPAPLKRESWLNFYDHFMVWHIPKPANRTEVPKRKWDSYSEDLSLSDFPEAWLFSHSLSLPLADKSLIRGNKFSSNHCTAASTNGEQGCQLYRNVPIMCSLTSLLLRLLQCFTCDTNDTWKVTHRRVERHDTSDFLWRCSKDTQESERMRWKQEIVKSADGFFLYLIMWPFW